MSDVNVSSPDKAATGIPGLDTILKGGLPRHWIYLIQGEPGTGKTTFGLQFLQAGIHAGERVLYITLSHTKRELQEIAYSHSWSLEQMPIHELSAGEALSYLAPEQTVFHTAEVELKETIDAILEVVKKVRPERLVFDPIEQIRLLTDNPLRYRKQLLTLKQALTGMECTTLLLTGEPAGRDDRELQSLVHGGVELEHRAPDYGEVRRRLKINKGRGMRYFGGYHSFQIRTGGLEVYPRLEAPEADERAGWLGVKSGVQELDTLLGGGLEEGTACLLVGPTGTGKSSLATLFAHTAALRGERSAIFLFDERAETFRRRSSGPHARLS